MGLEPSSFTFTSLSAVEQFLSDHGVSTGMFNDLYLGDYFKVQDGTYNVEWEIAGFDTYYQKGDTAFTNHHIALIPKTNLLTSKMNDTNDTTGGYYNSYMHQSVIPTIDTNLATILGNHLLARRALLSNAMNKELNLDAIHDTVHEMARDEARHGRGFEGLYNRYFKK